MAVLEEDFALGAPSATVASSNTSGSAAAIIINGTSTMVFDPLSAVHGPGGISVVGDASSSAAIWGWASPKTPASWTSSVHRFYFSTDTTINVATALSQLRNSTTFGCTIGTNASAQLSVINGGNATIHTFTSVPLLPSTVYRCEWAATQGASTGTMNVSYFLGDSLTPLDNWSGTGLNTGASAFATWRAVGRQTGAFLGKMRFANVGMQDGTTAFLGPVQQSPAIVPVYNRAALVRASSF